MAAVRFMCAYPFVPKGWVPICKYAEEMLGYKMGKWKVKVKHLYCGLALIFTRVGVSTCMVKMVYIVG